MAILWPSTLPDKPVSDSYGESIPDPRLRTSMSSGPAKVRRKTAALPVTFSVSLSLSNTQLEEFEDFVETTLDGGTLRFEFAHPRKETTVEMRFVGGDSLYTVSAQGVSLFSVSFQLEALP